MKNHAQLLVIGAGPFGLSAAAYAKHLGMEPVILGKPMEFWKRNMPRGMYLRSASDWHLDPVGVHTMDQYWKTQGLTAKDVEPLSLERYLGYCAWFQKQKRLETVPKYVERLDCAGDGGRGFVATLEDGEPMAADIVVVALGVGYFQNVPDELAGMLPAGRYAHTCDFVEFEQLRGKRCLIVGGRQSAFEWAALVHEAGAAEVHVCHRHPSPAFAEADWTWVNPLVDGMVDNPGWFRRLPAEEKKTVIQRLWAEGRLKVEPWLETRLRQESVKLWPNTQVGGGEVDGAGGLRVRLERNPGGGASLTVDQIILATGYKVDLAKVPFLAAGNLLGGLEIEKGFPVLDEHFQTNVPGLYCTSMLAARDFGPFFGFTVSARTSAKLIGQGIQETLSQVESD